LFVDSYFGIYCSKVHCFLSERNAQAYFLVYYVLYWYIFSNVYMLCSIGCMPYLMGLLCDRKCVILVRLVWSPIAIYMFLLVTISFQWSMNSTNCSSSGRAKKKMDELERLLEIAKKNYVQFGGRLGEDRRKLKEDRDNKRFVWCLKHVLSDTVEHICSLIR